MAFKVTCIAVFYSRIAEIFGLCRHAGQVEAKTLLIMASYDFICVRFDRLREENFYLFSLLLGRMGMGVG